MIYKYNDFLLEKKFNQILNDIFLISEGKWIDDKTYEWDLKKKDTVFDKLKNFLSGLSKESIKNYFYDFIEKVRKLPNSSKIIARYSTVFLIFVSASYLINSVPPGKEPIPKNIENVISKISNTKGSSFEEAQNFVKLVEGGYTSDKSDKGNYIKTPYGKRLIGTNHGISAPVLADWLGKLPTKEDMINLTYEDALKIYKDKYWDSQNLSEYKDQSVATMIYDGCVNQGVYGMSEIIKNAVYKQNLNINNPFNIEDIKRINKLDQEKLFNDIKKLREEKYKKGKKKYIKGWLNRLNSLNYK